MTTSQTHFNTQFGGKEFAAAGPMTPPKEDLAPVSWDMTKMPATPPQPNPYAAQPVVQYDESDDTFKI